MSWQYDQLTPAVGQVVCFLAEETERLKDNNSNWSLAPVKMGIDCQIESEPEQREWSKRITKNLDIIFHLQHKDHRNPLLREN